MVIWIGMGAQRFLQGAVSSDFTAVAQSLARQAAEKGDAEEVEQIYKSEIQRIRTSLPKTEMNKSAELVILNDYCEYLKNQKRPEAGSVEAEYKRVKSEWRWPL